MYVFLMTSTTQEETIRAKHSFEKHAEDLAQVWIRRYHADNGRFAEEGFCQEIRNAQQSISFCGVGAHHQSSIIERGIGQLTEICLSL